MFHSGQVVWNSKDKKPEYQDDLEFGPDTYLSHYFGILPKYVQRHFILNKVKHPALADEIFCPESIEQALELLAQDKIKPAPMFESHWECCGQWKTNLHMWWCSNTPKYSKEAVTEYEEWKRNKELRESLFPVMQKWSDYDRP